MTTEAVDRAGKEGKGAKEPHLKSLPKVDKAAFEATLAALAAEAEERQAKLAQLDAAIKEAVAARRAGAAADGSGASRARLAELNAAFKAALVRAGRGSGRVFCAVSACTALTPLPLPGGEERPARPADQPGRRRAARARRAQGGPQLAG